MFAQTHPPEIMIAKLAQHTALSIDDCATLNTLPYRLGSVEPGAYMIRAGDKTQNCGLILKGFAFGSSTTSDGHRQIVSVYMRGDLINLAGGIMPVTDHGVQALTHADVAYIPHDALFDLASQHPSIGRALWRDTLVDASIARQWMVSLGRRNARQRVSHFICEIGRRQNGAELTDGDVLVWPFTQEQVADAVGLTPVHVNRTLHGLRDERFFSGHRHNLTIMDAEGLRDAGDFRSGYIHSVNQPLAA